MLHFRIKVWQLNRSLPTQLDFFFSILNVWSFHFSLCHCDLRCSESGIRQTLSQQAEGRKVIKITDAYSVCVSCSLRDAVEVKGSMLIRKKQWTQHTQLCAVEKTTLLLLSHEHNKTAVNSLFNNMFSTAESKKSEKKVIFLQYSAPRRDQNTLLLLHEV